MTIQGALNDLSNLINSSDIPMYYKPSLKKIKETIELEMQPKVGEWICTDDMDEWYGKLFQCSVCGAKVLEVDRYCTYCGSYNGGDEE